MLIDHVSELNQFASALAAVLAAKTDHARNRMVKAFLQLFIGLVLSLWNRRDWIRSHSRLSFGTIDLEAAIEIAIDLDLVSIEGLECEGKMLLVRISDIAKHPNRDSFTQT